MAINIKEFHIGQYRGISDLSLKDLNHINVLTGKNDTGKTSILELIDTISNPLRSDIWQSVSTGSHFGGTSIYEELMRMFPYGQDDKIIDYDYTDKDNQQHIIRLSADISQSLVSQKELMRLNGYVRAGDHEPTDDDIMPSRMLQIHISKDDETSDFSVFDVQQAMKTPKDRSFDIDILYIGPQVTIIRNYLYLAQALMMPEFKKSMVGLLKSYDNNITGFELIDRECFLQLGNKAEMVPLSLFGDGIKKAVDIVAATFLVHNGILLIDEIENSIHPSVIKATLQWLVETALANNVQVFMSTHSMDTLLDICSLSDDYKEKVNIYTLYHNDTIHVRKMNAVKASEVVKMGVSLL